MATGSALVLLLLLPFQKATAFVSDIRKWNTASQLVTNVPISGSRHWGKHGDIRHTGHGLSALPHTCALRAV